MIECGYCQTRIYPDEDGRARHKCSPNSPFSGGWEYLKDESKRIIGVYNWNKAGGAPDDCEIKFTGNMGTAERQQFASFLLNRLNR